MSKKKIKDLTFKEMKKICNEFSESLCICCPLFQACPLANDIGFRAIKEDKLDCEVEVDE